ncbi:MAG TPA: hypothetical protein VL793_00380 [Patescibacteria group bacterium]|jgi:hypothetical protein|nr:hypothetical protein [Patescibacteria group bacterium]
MNWNRVLSILVAAFYVGAGGFAGGARAAFLAAAFSILPLACIWFCEAMGGYIGPTSRGAITGSSPGILVCIVGWLLLLLPAIVELINVSSP